MIAFIPVIYEYAEKNSIENSKDVGVPAFVNLKTFEITVTTQNIFNGDYTETNLVPMPKGNLIFRL